IAVAIGGDARALDVGLDARDEQRRKLVEVADLTAADGAVQTIGLAPAIADVEARINAGPRELSRRRRRFRVRKIRPAAFRASECLAVELRAEGKAEVARLRLNGVGGRHGGGALRPSSVRRD